MHGVEDFAGNRKPNTAPIGLFDSGVGGLTVARAVMDQLPGESLIYIGDTAHGPYGPQPIADAVSYTHLTLPTNREV